MNYTRNVLPSKPSRKKKNIKVIYTKVLPTIVVSAEKITISNKVISINAITS